jgi:S1-C subfamily serine protease
MTLQTGWRRGNISWRPTTWELRRLGFGGMKLVAITDDDYRRLGLAQEHMALRAIHVGEYGDHAIAKHAGFQKGDIIVSFDGKDHRMTESELLAYALQQKRPGDRADVVIVRDGTRKNLSFVLPK